MSTGLKDSDFGRVHVVRAYKTARGEQALFRYASLDNKVFVSGPTFSDDRIGWDPSRDWKDIWICEMLDELWR